ncbi:MAG: penicillin-binding protein 2 [Candidatus Pacebacteria bacterium]|nr:penicillin-binding protein 2 [Candidatus Paceibacterota bacterium]
MKSDFNFRSKVIAFFFLAGALVFGAKLFFVQIVHGRTYSDLADRQYVTPSSEIFERGDIFFNSKDNVLVSAATQTQGYKLAINPEKLKDPEQNFQIIHEILPSIMLEDFVARANKKGDPYEEILGGLTREEADKISALKISGIEIHKEKWRFYPGKSLAAHTLGFVAYKGDELSGRYGLERQYEQVLARDEDNPYVNFFAEVFSNINEGLFSEGEKKGNIVTTIEPKVQTFLERTLKEVKEKYNVDQIGGIIMNPADGSIYAISAKPDFDLNDFKSVDSTSVYRNPFVENVLEFGSVVKPLVMASALDAGVVTADTKYDDRGSVVVEKKEIWNFDKKGRGPGTSMQDVLNQSLNTGMVFTYKKLGKDRMKEYLLAFGIKEKTGIDLPNETSGLVSNLNSPREIEFANASFGQGIALTPIEMVRALSSLGNGGKLVTPHLVDRIKYDNGTEKKIEYETKPTKITEATSEEITRMLVTVMDKSPKGGLAKMEHHSIAVKTGTAQVANADGGGYYEDRHTHSFFGYFPAYEPKFIVFLYAVNPKGVPYAAQTWADPFIDLSKFLINYYQVPPDR